MKYTIASVLIAIGVVITSSFPTAAKESAPVANEDLQEAGLTSEQVRKWLKVRIELAQMQNEMKQNAHKYEDLPLAYHEKSVSHLAKVGYDYERFKSHETRISAARTYINDYEMEVRAQEEQIAQAEQGFASDTIKIEAVAEDEIRELIRTMRQLGMPESEIETTVANVRGKTTDIAPVDVNPNPSSSTIAEMRETLTQYKHQMAKAEPDVDAVRQWLPQLRQFDSWYANNSSHLPKL